MNLQTRGSLHRHLPRSQPTEDELFAMRRAAWRKQGIIVIRPADIQDEWTRAVVTNAANMLYGPRKTQ